MQQVDLFIYQTNENRFITSQAFNRLHNKKQYVLVHCRWLRLIFLFFSAAIKEERFRFGNGYDQVEDVIGVAQPVRFNSKQLASS